MKRFIILVFMINCFFSKKYLLELKSKAGHKDKDKEVDEKLDEEKGDDYSLSSPSLKMEELGLIIQINFR